MAGKTAIPLPIADQEYNQENELITRILVEQAIQDINSDIGSTQTLQQSNVSKAIKRHQFLLMGASSV